MSYSCYTYPFILYDYENIEQKINETIEKSISNTDPQQKIITTLEENKAIPNSIPNIDQKPNTTDALKTIEKSISNTDPKQKVITTLEENKTIPTSIPNIDHNLIETTASDKQLHTKYQNECYKKIIGQINSLLLTPSNIDKLLEISSQD